MLITLTFDFPLNVSVQASPLATFSNYQGADVVYYVPTTPVPTSHTPPVNTPQIWAGTTTPHQTGNNVVEIGPVVEIIPWNGNEAVIVADTPPGTIAPTVNDFIFFSKDNKANLSSMLGYFASVEFRNDSVNEGEIFSVGCEIFESSK
jgi:hypothetical protein